MNTALLKKLDWPLLFSAILLSSIGLVVLYGFGLYSKNFDSFQKQLVFLIVGIILAIFLALLDFRALKESSLFVFVLYFVGILLLVGLFFFGSRIRGVKAWYVFGGFTFQPVELMKIIYVLFFAKYFSARHVEMYHKEHIIVSAIYGLFPAFLVFLQPDFGSAMILVIVWLLMMLVSGIKRQHLFIILAIGIIGSLIAWNFFLSQEQKSRITTFLEPYVSPQKTYLDPKGSGYHISQSVIAVGSGGIFGKGFSQPYTQAKLGFLPEAHTDFMFASFVEIFGLLGLVFLFLILMFFFWRLYKIAIITSDNFSRLLISGFMVLFGTGIFINIAMNIGLLPITGVPLSFLSYGGSNIVSLFIGIGIIESVKAYTPEKIA